MYIYVYIYVYTDIYIYNIGTYVPIGTCYVNNASGDHPENV